MNDELISHSCKCMDVLYARGMFPQGHRRAAEMIFRFSIKKYGSRFRVY